MANRTICCLDASSPPGGSDLGYRRASSCAAPSNHSNVSWHMKRQLWQFSPRMVLFSGPRDEFDQIHTHTLVPLTKSGKKSDRLRVVHFVSGRNTGTTSLHGRLLCAWRYAGTAI